MDDAEKLKYFNDGLKLGYDQAKADITTSIESKMELLQDAIHDLRDDRMGFDPSSLKAQLRELEAVLTIIKTIKFKVQ
jgi:hypothetical protein